MQYRNSSLTIVLVTICFSCVAQCKDVKDIVQNYKKEKYQAQAAQATTKAAITFVLKKMIGSSATIITGILDPNTVATPYDVFASSLIRIEKLANNENINWSQYEKELENLRIAGQGIRVERLFADNSECYDNIDYIVMSYETINKTIKKLP